MKILQLTNKVPFPLKDGGAIATMTLSQGLVNKGVDLTMLSMNTPKHYCLYKDIPYSIRQKIPIHIVDVVGISFKSILSNLLFSSLPYTASRFIDKAYTKKLIQLLQESDYDIVQLEGLYLAPYITVIRQYSSAKIVMRAHNVEQIIWQRVQKNTSQLFKKLYLSNLVYRLKKFEVSFFNDYDLLLPITEKDAHTFRQLSYQKDMYVLPTGIDICDYSVKKMNFDDSQLFFLGALDWEPNLEGLRWFFTEVWPLVLKENPKVKLHLAGRNASVSTIRFLEKQVSIIYHGEVEDAKAYMNQYGIMIVPLLSGSGMRIKIIEGMALSKIIVATSVALEGIDAQDGKNIVLANTAREYASKISILLKDSSICYKIADKSRRFIQENFDNERILQNLLNKYEKLIAEK